MPSEVVHTIKPDGTGNYTLLSGWETAQQRDLVGADQIAVAECYSGQITDNVFLGGWTTTDATRRIIIRAAAGHEHGGSRAAGFRITDTTGEIIRTEEAALIQGIVLLPTNNVIAIGTRASYVELQVAGCVIYGGGSSTGTGVAIAHAGTAKVWNSLIYGFNGATLGPGVAVSAGTAHIYNNTIANNRRGIQQTAGTCRPKNNITQDCANACFSGAMTDSAANISEDTTSPQTGLRSISLTFVDQAGGDYHLAAGDTAAIGAGSDLHADADLAFAYDIDGDARPDGDWDIGADQFVAAGAWEYLDPIAIQASSNLQDSAANSPPQLVSDLQDAPASPDGLWHTAVDDHAVTDERLRLAAPQGTLTGQQSIDVLVRAAGLPCRDSKVELWEDGAQLTSVAQQAVTSTDGQIVTLTFPASEVTDKTKVEIRIVAVNPA